MEKPDAALAPKALALYVYCKVFTHQLSDNRRSNFKAARAAAKNDCDGASLFILSKAALCFGTDQLVRTLGPGAELREPTSDELISFTNEADFYLNLAAECAWDGAECRSALCAAYYAELITLLGPVGIKAGERLKKLQGALIGRDAQWKDPRDDRPSAEAGVRDDLGPCLLEVRSLWLLLQNVAAAWSEHWRCAHMKQKLAWSLLRGYKHQRSSLAHIAWTVAEPARVLVRNRTWTRRSCSSERSRAAWKR